jgi:hypothetical protein
MFSSRSDPTSQVILYRHCGLCVLVAGRAGLVHVLHETVCLAEAWTSVCCEADTRGGLVGILGTAPACSFAMWRW